MYRCPNFEQCSAQFFNTHLQNLQSISFLIEHEFCLVNYTRCARFVLGQALGVENLPSDLYPTQYREASQVITKTEEAEADNPVLQPEHDSKMTA